MYSCVYEIKGKQWWAVELNTNALGKNNRAMNFTGPPIFLIIKVLTLRCGSIHHFNLNMYQYPAKIMNVSFTEETMILAYQIK